MNLPELTTIRSKDRTLIHVWELDKADHDGVPTTVEAHLSTQHDGNRKSFFATLRVTTRKQENGYTTEGCWLFDYVRVPITAPCPRFSVARLEAAHALAVAELRLMAEADHEGVVKTFESRLDNMQVV